MSNFDFHITRLLESYTFIINGVVAVSAKGSDSYYVDIVDIQGNAYRFDRDAIYEATTQHPNRVTGPEIVIGNDILMVFQNVSNEVLYQLKSDLYDYD